MKTTTKKPSSRKTSAPKTPARGTVGWLLAELKKFPKDMYVLHGDHDAKYYEGSVVEVDPTGDWVAAKIGGKEHCVYLNA